MWNCHRKSRWLLSERWLRLFLRELLRASSASTHVTVAIKLQSQPQPLSNSLLCCRFYKPIQSQVAQSCFQQKLWLKNFLLSKNKQDTSHRRSMWDGLLSGNLILLSISLLCLASISCLSSPMTLGLDVLQWARLASPHKVKPCTKFSIQIVLGLAEIAKLLLLTVCL